MTERDEIEAEARNSLISVLGDHKHTISARTNAGIALAAGNHLDEDVWAQVLALVSDAVSNRHRDGAATLLQGLASTGTSPGPVAELAAAFLWPPGHQDSPDNLNRMAGEVLLMLSSRSSRARRAIAANPDYRHVVKTSKGLAVTDRWEKELDDLSQRGSPEVIEGLKSALGSDVTARRDRAAEILGATYQALVSDRPTPPSQESSPEGTADGAVEDSSQPSPIANLQSAQVAVDAVYAAVEQLLLDADERELELHVFERRLLEEMADQLRALSERIRSNLKSGGGIPVDIPGAMQTIGRFIKFAASIEGAAGLAERADRLEDAAASLIRTL